MTVFVDENRDEFGVEPVLRGGADRPVYLLRAQTAGSGTAALLGPQPAG